MPRLRVERRCGWINATQPVVEAEGVSLMAVGKKLRGTDTPGAKGWGRAGESRFLVPWRFSSNRRGCMNAAHCCL